jgi:hypothetical protein
LKRAWAALIALAIAIGGCARGPEPHQLEAQLRRELPIGTPASQVDAYLTAHKWRHSYLPDERSYLAGVLNVGSRFSLTREDIAVRINFDKRGRLESMTVTPFFSYHGRSPS